MDNYRNVYNGEINSQMKKVLDNFISIFNDSPIDSYRLKEYLKQFIMNNTPVDSVDFRTITDREWLIYVQNNLEWSDKYKL